MKIFVIIFLLLMSTNVFSLSIDEKLDLVKKVYKLKAKECSLQKNLKVHLNAGKKLFESKSLSGNRDISCLNCHLEKFSSTDGLPLAVGVGGSGEGHSRYFNKKGVLVQRNAFSLKGRSNKFFTSFFWDGKAQNINGVIVTQFGEKVSKKFDSTLAAASILPLIERDEFLGESQNQFKKEASDTYYYSRYNKLGELIRNRLLTSKNADDIALKQSLISAGLKMSELELADIGNLIAAHIDKEFPCKSSDWDKYINGNKNALSLNQKRGAILFYGKGRCASCHSGSFNSDMDFHSIGAPQGYFGPHSRHRDIGRAAVTNKPEDLFKFRTPALNDVKNTAPYGHSGAFKTLDEVIIQHFNPFDFYLKNSSYYKADFYNIGRIIDSRDPLLKTLDLNKANDVVYLREFLKSL